MKINNTTPNPTEGAVAMTDSYRFTAGEELLKLATFLGDEVANTKSYKKLTNMLNDHLEEKNKVSSHGVIMAWCSGESSPHVRYHVAIAKVLGYGGDPGRLWKKEAA